MAAVQWFRLYAEFATDPKIQMLSECNQRRYIMLLCLRCSNGDVTLHDEEVAFQLRISNEEYADTKSALVSKGLVNESNQPTAWNKRQFISDSSAARVAKHRASKKQTCNVTETKSNALDTDTDTDTDKNKTVTRKNALDYSSWPTMPDEQTMTDWITMRKRLKANVTQTVINRLAPKLKEAVNAGYSVNDCISECVERNWKGFELLWMQKSNMSQQTPSHRISPSEQAKQNRRDRVNA